MGTIAEHRAAIKANLEATFVDATVFDNIRKGYPSVRVWEVGMPDQYDPRASQAGGRDITYRVRFMVPWADDESSDAVLEEVMDAAVAAIESDRTLGGTCDDLSCGPFTDIGATRNGDDTVVMQFVIPVEVLD